MLKRLLCVSAGSSRWGTGHLRRTLALVSLLRRKGWDLAAVAWVPEGPDRQKLQPWLGSFNQTLGPGDVLTDGFCQGLIIDVPEEFQPGLLPWLNRVQRPVAALDWYGDKAEGLFQTVNLRGGRENLRWAIVRPEFHQALERRAKAAPDFDLVIMAGGGDGRDLWDKLKIVLASPQMALRKIAVIRGPLAPRESWAFQSDGLKIYRNPENLADLMARAKVAVTNGGTSMMEFAFLGVPMIICPQSRQEDHFCKLFVDSGAGVLGKTSPEEILLQIKSLWDGEVVRQQMSLSGSSLIDGKGLERITGIIADIVGQGTKQREGQNESVCR